MRNISDKQVEQVINLYNSTESIIETAKASGLSTVKVRKILITLGLWKSETSIAIGSLLQQGLTTEQIAARLFMSVKNVQAYMPYERGIYRGKELTAEAIRSDRYRKRMRQAASMQIVKNNERLYRQEDEIMEGSQMKNTISLKKSQVSRVLKLHCELERDWYGDEKEILQKYGFMKKSISRDVLVPADITLHALHYALLRMFGWQNSHLHCYSLPQDVFDKLTEQQFVTWARLVGVYFRFPSEDFEDIYWDDDYKEGQSFKSWMKKKYTGPFRYNGFSEHYLNAQDEVSMFFERWQEVTVHEFSLKENKPPYNVKLVDATVREVEQSFGDFWCHELVERLPIEQVLCTPGVRRQGFAQIRKKLFEQLAKIDIDEAIYKLACGRFKSLKQEQKHLANYNVDAIPITNKLLYQYDYGDNWRVWITCTEAYEKTEDDGWRALTHTSVDATEEALMEVLEKYRPVCVAKDGIELLDDVGGIGGFCDMLREIHEYDFSDPNEAEERHNMIAWANMMGWTGRRISPKHTL